MSPSDTRVPLVSGPLPKPPRRPAILATVLALGALGLGGWLWKTADDAAGREQQALQRLTTIETRSADLQRQQQRLLDDLTLRGRQLDDVGARLAKWDDTLNADQRRAWLLSEADHYLRLAEQHLLLTRDITGARALLDVADRLLAAHGDNRLLPLREALSRDRLALVAAATVDVPGTYLRLGALDERVGRLQLPVLAGDRAQARGQVDAPPAATTEGSAAPTLWQAGWARLRALITVRHYNEPVRPLLSDSERQMVREALRLDLAQAQLALLRGEPVIYRQSLTTAGTRLSQYFSLLPKAEFDGLQAELTGLAGIDIRPAMPTLTAIASLDRLLGSPSAGALQ
ncbi:MAG: uroporphyrinogen-III C-methyltransferase [Moraxellaceae bacterium]|nr:uroporphyrinogen-III C-methyltransferase [Moraxellaceae bacterium]